MVVSTEYFAETPDICQQSVVLDDALRSLRVSGNLVLRESYAPPWAIDIPHGNALAALLNVPGSTRVVAFHLVEFGHCEIAMADGDARLLRAGEMAICFGGAAHRLSQGKARHAEPLEKLLAGGPNIQRPDANSRSDQTGLLCGVFMLRHTVFNPLFSALPSLMHSNLSRPGELHNLSGVARLMAEEIDRRALGGGFVVERLLEVLCAEAMRSHIEAVSGSETSWFQGIRDPVVGRAIAAIHERPGEDWSVRRMAEDVAMSPSRFATRFSASVGDSPMAYVTKWRMSLACRDLVATEQSVDRVAESVGYESPAAFSRAFKRHLGLSPAAWRARERA